MDIYSVLAEPTRRTILELLAKKGQLPASDIYDEFAISYPAISQHLKVLRESKLVTVEKQAQVRLYRINPDAIDEVEEWLRRIKLTWSERFDRLGRVLEQEKKKLTK